MKKIRILLCGLLITLFGFFIACGDDDIVKLNSVDAQGVSYNGEVITWSKVENAGGYYISIDESTEEFVANSDVPSYVIKMAKSFTIKITSASLDLTKYENSDQVSVDFTMLEKVNIRKEKDHFAWDSVSGAVSYLIDFNNSVSTEVVDNCKYSYIEGFNTLRVMPVPNKSEGGNKTFAVWSDSVTVNVLNAPQNIFYDVDVIKWDKVEGAKEYVVKIDGKEETVTENRFVYSAAEKSFEVEIYAVPSNPEDRASKASIKSFKFSDPCINIICEKGIVIWEPIDGIMTYQVETTDKSGNTKYEIVDTNAYSGLDEGISYSFRVRPFSYEGNIYSIWSEYYEFTLLEAPKTVWDNGNITWPRVQGVNSYDGYQLLVYCDGKEDDTFVTRVETLPGDIFSVRLLETLKQKAGIYRVSVYATTSALQGYSGSKPSEPITIVSLGSPYDFSVSSDIYGVNGIEILFNDVYEADYYTVQLNGTDYSQGITSENGITSINIAKLEVSENGGDYNITVIAKSTRDNEFDASTRRVILDCSSERAGSVEISTLPVPQNLKIVNNVVSWNQLDMCSGYVLTIKDENGVELDGFNKRVVSDTTYFLDELESGLYNITVSARGNGNIIISSEESSPITFVKLEAPRNVRVDPTKERTVVWDPVETIINNQIYQPENYEIKVGSRMPVSVDTNSYTIELDDISIAGTQIVVYAKGNNGVNDEYNGISTQDSWGSNTIQTLLVFRLPSPSAPSVNDTQIYWNEVAGAIRYDIYNRDTRIGSTTSSEPYIKLSDLDSFSGDCDLCIRAIGELEKGYFPSASSIVKTIEFLETPNVKIDSDSGLITWDLISSASGYLVEINENSYVLGREVTEYNPALFGNDGDEVNIKVTALGDNGIMTVSSKPCEFVKRLSKLEKVTGTFTVTVDADDHRKIYVTINETTETLGRGYGICIGGVEQKIYFDKLQVGEKKNVLVFDALTSATFDVKVRALGGNYTADGTICYLNSDYSEVKTYSLLQAIDAKNVNLLDLGNGKKSIEFTNIAYAKSYDYKITFLDTENNEISYISGNISAVTTGRNVILLESIPANAYNCIIEIKTIGDGTTSFDSAENLRTILRLR